MERFLPLFASVGDIQGSHRSLKILRFVPHFPGLESRSGPWKTLNLIFEVREMWVSRNVFTKYSMHSYLTCIRYFFNDTITWWCSASRLNEFTRRGSGCKNKIIRYSSIGPSERRRIGTELIYFECQHL